MSSKQRAIVNRALEKKRQEREDWHQQNVQLREWERDLLRQLAKEMDLPLRDVVALGIQLAAQTWKEVETTKNNGYAGFWKHAKESTE